MSQRQLLAYTYTRFSMQATTYSATSRRSETLANQRHHKMRMRGLRICWAVVVWLERVKSGDPTRVMTWRPGVACIWLSHGPMTPGVALGWWSTDVDCPIKDWETFTQEMVHSCINPSISYFHFAKSSCCTTFPHWEQPLKRVLVKRVSNDYIAGSLYRLYADSFVEQNDLNNCSW
jgi:hypothetical protein